MTAALALKIDETENQLNAANSRHDLQKLKDKITQLYAMLRDAETLAAAVDDLRSSPHVTVKIGAKRSREIVLDQQAAQELARTLDEMRHRK